MKILDDNEGWRSKVNFVDENNVVLGYDMAQGCCEYADWFISDEVTPECVEREGDKPNLDGWNFDVNFFKEIDGCEFEDGGMAVFRITNGDAEKFVHLFNVHNGYYSHGFRLEVGGSEIEGGSL